MTPYCLAKAAQIVAVVVVDDEVTKQHGLLLLVEVPVLLSVADLVELPLVAQAKHLQVSQIHLELPRLPRCP